jgi:hypothetical protein
MQQILYNAHGLISPIYPTAMILSDKTILTEDIENNNPFTIDTTTSTTQPHYKLYYDTLRKYYAIEFKHLSPDTLLNIINEHNKYNIQFDQTAKGQMKTASGILPLYPHHLVVLQVLCKKYNMKYYESKPEQKQYYIIPRKN